jgi:CHAD domain-containing protein
MATTTEIERKFVTPDDFVLPDLTAIPGVASVDDPVELNLDATYYDTVGLTLARNRMTLRHRRGGHDAGWHLKRPAGSDRTEMQVPATPRSRKVPDALIGEVWALSRGQELVPIARVRNRRLERAVRDGRGAVLALIAADSVASKSYEAAGGEPEARQWHELEAELVDGSRTLLEALSSELLAAGARPADSPSKLAQALGDKYPSGRGYEASRRGDAAGSGGRAVAAYLHEQREALLHNDALVRVGDVDGVHDMRVAVRRLRATLRTFRPMLDRARTEPLRDELHWLGGLLGAVRDGDVLRRRFDKAIAAEPPDTIAGPVTATIHERLGTSAGQARTALDAAMTSARYAHVLDELDAVLDAVPDNEVGSATGNEVGRPIDKRLRRAARKAVLRADERLGAALRLPAHPAGVAFPNAAPQSRDVALHESRKAYKRARYAVEALAAAVGRPARRLAKRLRTLQDILGEHQDSVVGAQLLRDFGMRAHLDGENAFGYGILYARQTSSDATVLASLDRARRRAGRRDVRAWLD